MARKQYPRVISPVATAAYAWLQKPDEGHQFSDGKYKVTLVMDSNDAATQEFLQQLEEKMEETAVAEWGKTPKNLRSPVKDGDDTDKEEFAGKTLIVTKTKFQPGFVDSVGNTLPEDVFPASGDVIRASMTLFPYKASGTPGISLQLRNVQLVEKRNMGADATADFGTVEGGFVAQAKVSADTVEEYEDDDGDF